MRKFTFILISLAAVCFGANAQKIEAYNAETNFATWSGTPSSYVDGDYTTFFWSAEAQTVGKYCMLEIENTTSIGEIKLYFTGSDMPNGAKVDISTDNSDWQNIATFAAADIKENCFVCDADGMEAKYVRMIISENNSNWFQLKEFEVYEYIAPVSERTISATATEGGVVTLNGATDAVTSTAPVVLKAEPEFGYKFVNWTVNGEEVSTEAEYSDITDGNKDYVANFAKCENVDECYAATAKPTFAKAGSTTMVNELVFDEEPITDFTYVAGKANNVNTAIKVVAGETYTLNVKYQMRWGDLAMYQIDKNGAEKKYGYYTCVWEPAADPLTILERDNSALMCEELGITEFAALETGIIKVDENNQDKSVVLPYRVTIDAAQQPGDLVVVRLIVGKKGDNNSAYEKNIVEGGCLDILLQVKPKDSETAIENVEVENAEQVIYDLSGRRVEMITKAGIYIVNGNKVLVK